MSSKKSKVIDATLEKNRPQPADEPASAPGKLNWLCIPNPDSHQYGVSFTVSRSAGQGRGNFNIENGTADDVEIVSLDENQKYFLKIPDTNKAGHSKEIRKEGLNKDGINQAKTNLETWNTTEQKNTKGTFYAFRIVEMIGEVTMVPNNKNDQALHGLVYKYVESSALDEYPIKSLQLKDLNKEIGESSKLFLQFARSFAYAVQKLHNQSIVHSFIVPRNIIPNKPEKVVIDPETKHSIDVHPYTLVGFGYARMGTSSGRSKNTLVLDDRSNEDRLYLAPEYKTPNEYGGHWFPADIYSIGAILYATLCYGLVRSAEAEGKGKGKGKGEGEGEGERLAEAERNTKQLIDSVLHDAPRDVLRLKKLIGSNLDLAAKQLVGQNENVLKIIDQCLRYNPEDRFSCAEELIDAIELAIEAELEPLDSTTKTIIVEIEREKEIKAAYESLTKHEVNKLLPKFLISAKLSTGSTDASAPSNEEPLHPDISAESLTGSADEPAPPNEEIAYADNTFLIGLMKERIDSFRADRQKLQSGHFEVFGSRDKIISSLCRMLCSSGKDYEYHTMTIPHYWLSENLGPLGRFLTMNKHKARRGLKIKRLFLVDVENFQLLKANEQSMLLDHLKAQKDTNEYVREEGKPCECNFEVRVKFVESSDINSFEREGNTVGYLKPSKKGGELINKLSLCLNFYSVTTSEWRYGKEYVSRKITKVRYMVPKETQLKKFVSKFNTNWEDAMTLDTYINKGRFNSGDTEVDQSQMENVDLRKLIC